MKNAAELARRAGISKGTLRDCVGTEGNPSLDVVIRLCAASRVPPGALFGLRATDDSDTSATMASSCSLPDAVRKPRRDWNAIRAAMHGAMQDLDNVPTVAEFAARHEVCARSLRDALPAMTQALSSLSKKRQERDAERAVAAMVQRAQHCARQLSDAGLKPTTRRIAEMVGARRESTVFALAMRRLRGVAPALSASDCGVLSS